MTGGELQALTEYAAIELLGWRKSARAKTWLSPAGLEMAPITWSPFTDDDDAWVLFSGWTAAKQIHKTPEGISVVVHMPNADLVTFGGMSGRYCGPLLCQAMAAGVGHYREAMK